MGACSSVHFRNAATRGRLSIAEESGGVPSRSTSDSRSRRTTVATWISARKGPCARFLGRAQERSHFAASTTRRGARDEEEMLRARW